MAACPACGFEYEGSFKFCPECAAPLAAPARAVAEERKVVTCLFCDLVGFTASSESADPEDVDRMLSAYAEMARSRIEGHGGVVEKFIGDAVVGIFGVPAAHEDDPERAVRAGLRIVEGAEELRSLGGEPLRLRVGINTGEALVRLGCKRAMVVHGEGGPGDVQQAVNFRHGRANAPQRTHAPPQPHERFLDFVKLLLQVRLAGFHGFHTFQDGMKTS